MKRVLISAAIIAAVLCGCKKEDGYGQYEPTRPGYYMFRQVDTALCGEFSDVMPVFAFALYYAADNDAERETIHDAFFYTSRISGKDGQWRIINDSWELVIVTGGKSLYDQGAQWTYDYISRTDNYGEALPTITGNGQETFTLRLPERPKEASYTTGDLRVKAAYEYLPISPGAYVHSIRLTVSGTGKVYTDDIDVGFETTFPLEYDSYASYIGKGAMKLTTTNDGVTDTAQATYTGTDNEIRIEYNEHQKVWETTYGYNFCNE